MIDQLADLRMKHEHWREDKLNLVQQYFDYMLKLGLIITYEEEGKVLGYLEYWRINYETLGKIVADVPYDPFELDLKEGPVAYVANTCVLPGDRKTEVFANLAKEFFKLNKDAESIIGRRQKRRYPITVYKGGRNG